MLIKTCETILHQLLPPVSRACLLVPELTLSILTSSNPLWHIPYEEAMRKLDRSDPWWAFLWPGSQALARFVFDHQNLFRGTRVLDLGCGCGASAIAAKLTGATTVIANDIDEDALVATRHNAKLNGITIDEYSSENILENPTISLQKRCVDWLIIGDMCYEDDLARSILNLIVIAQQHRVNILLADPGRFSFKTIVLHQLPGMMTQVAEYPIVDRDYIEPDFQCIQLWRTLI